MPETQDSVNIYRPLLLLSLASLCGCICALTEVLSPALWRPFLPLVILLFASGPD